MGLSKWDQRYVLWIFLRFWNFKIYQVCFRLKKGFFFSQNFSNQFLRISLTTWQQLSTSNRVCVCVRFRECWLVSTCPRTCAVQSFIINICISRALYSLLSPTPTVIRTWNPIEFIHLHICFGQNIFINKF